MSDSTPIFALPFPESTDPPDGPAQIGALAEEIEDQLVAGVGLRSCGKAIIDAEQSTTSTSYTLLGTPDRVQDIVLPADGLIFVHYRALVKSSSFPGFSFAALFLNGTQLKTMTAAAVPAQQRAAIDDNEYQWLTTTTGGLASAPAAGAASDGVTSGLAGATVCAIEAAAGSYTVSVQFAAASPTTSAKARRLRVWSQAFG